MSGSKYLVWLGYDKEERRAHSPFSGSIELPVYPVSGRNQTFSPAAEHIFSLTPFGFCHQTLLFLPMRWVPLSFFLLWSPPKEHLFGLGSPQRGGWVPANTAGSFGFPFQRLRKSTGAFQMHRSLEPRKQFGSGTMEDPLRHAVAMRTAQDQRLEYEAKRIGCTDLRGCERFLFTIWHLAGCH